MMVLVIVATVLGRCAGRWRMSPAPRHSRAAHLRPAGAARSVRHGARTGDPGARPQRCGRLLERSRRALAYSERHYRELVENLAERSSETDSGFLVSYVNPPWSAVVGRSTGETLGKPLTDFIASDPPTEFMQALDTLQRGGADADALTLHGLHPRARQGWPT